MSRRRAGPSDDPTSLKTMHLAAIQCLMCCESLITYSRLSQEKWFEAYKSGAIQQLADLLASSIAMAARIEREPRLTQGPPFTFGDVTGRNAHVAALIMARIVRSAIDVSALAHGYIAHDDLRNQLAAMPAYNFDAWCETVSSEADRAPRLAAQGTAEKKGDKAVQRDKQKEARDKWIYQRCCNGTMHDRIVIDLKARAFKRGWRVVSSKQRIQQIGNEYADRHGLERPAPRQNL